MQRGLELQQKLRKSEVLTEQDIYKDFMAYAKEVNDQLQIYIYMQENQIGIHDPQYWLARFQVMRRRCQFVSLVAMISKVKKIPDIVGWQIQYFQKKLQKDLERIVYYTFRGKRKASAFNLQQNAILHPENRKIGNIEVFVDEKCRQNYFIQDYAKHIEQEMKQYCSIERQTYKRQQASKPPSFLAKKQTHLMEMAEQLLCKSNRRSLNLRNSIRPPRFSNQNLPINIQNAKDYQTPKNNAPSFTPKTPNGKSQRVGGSRSRDSVQILKQMHQKHVLEKKSPRFGKDDEKDHFENKSDKAIQYCRSSKQHDDFCFSFGKNKKSFSNRKEIRRNAEQGEGKDDAFLIYSFSDESNSKLQNSLAIKKEDFQLELIIKQIQREAYQKLQSQTFSSEIDSNQENNYVENKTKIIFTQSKRKPFKNLMLTDSGKLLKDHEYQLEQLIQFDDDRNPQNLKSFEKSIKKQINNNIPIFLSEQKRLSNISQQGSYFSESRRKHQRHHRE